MFVFYYVHNSSCLFCHGNRALIVPTSAPQSAQFGCSAKSGVIWSPTANWNTHLLMKAVLIKQIWILNDSTPICHLKSLLCGRHNDCGVWSELSDTFNISKIICHKQFFRPNETYLLNCTGISVFVFFQWHCICKVRGKKVFSWTLLLY